MRKILKYEIKQLLRDKKTIILVFILPLVIMPLINGLLNKVINERIGEIFSGPTEFVSYDEPFLKEIFTRLEGDSIFSVVYTPSGTSVDSLLEKFPAVVTSEFRDSVKTGTVVVNYSSKKDRQNFQAVSVIRKLRNIRKDMSGERYSSIGIKDYYKNSSPEIRNIASPEEMSRTRSAGILPVTIIIVLVIGTFFISNYVILGEKDNNTLESLLSSGIKRRDIIYGKMSIVMLAGIIMSVLELISFWLYGKFTANLSFDIGLGAFQAWCLIPVLLSLSLLISSVSVFLSCRLRSSSSGQLLFLPVMLFYLLTALMGTFEGVSITRGFFLIPVVNSAGVMKEIFRGDPAIFSSVSVTVLNLLYSFLFVRSSSGYLNSEDILEKNTDLDIVKKGFSKGAVFTVFALLVVSYMLVGGYLQGRNIVSGLILSQVFILGGFAVVMRSVTQKPFAGILKLKKFDPFYIPAALILGLSSRYPITLVSEQLLKVFPVPDIMKENDIMGTALGDLNIIAAVFVIAVLPAFFEEFAFRGVFLSIMEKKYSKVPLLLITGLMFGLMHMNIFTVFETGVLGVVLGLLTVSSGSVFPAVIMHFTNNAFSVILMFLIKDGQITEDSFLASDISFAWIMTVITVLVLFAIVFRKRS
ncbi:MAG: CPBP family glutamic-type intramembrane protease [Candidatus Delongbacteria bacterium]